MKHLLIPILIIFSITASYSQDLPPGWDYPPTASSHVIAVPLESTPEIDGIPIAPGDHIGVFYFRDGVQYCGGAYHWIGTENIAITAFGNDYFSPEKDGFTQGEKFNWRVYSWSLAKEFEANVVYDLTFPNDSTFMQFGFSRLLDFSVTSLSATISAGSDTICDGQTTQLFAGPYGGSGVYFYSWTSNPAGFTSTAQNPVVEPDTSTKYYLQLYNYADTITDSITIFVKPTLPDVLYLQDETILGAESYHAVHIEAGSYVTVPPQGSFILESGAVVTCVGGQDIKLKEGFHAKSGSVFHAMIDSVFCPDTPDLSYGPQGNEETLNSTENITVDIYSQDGDFILYPNPVENILYIYHADNDLQPYQLDLLDVFGNMVMDTRMVTAKNYEMDLSQLSGGIYFIRFKCEGVMSTEKLIVK